MFDTTEGQIQEEQAVPEIVVDYEGECDSLTGRSVITFQAGRHPLSNVPMLRIARNSGRGMFCKDWVPVEKIDSILATADPVTARAFDAIHPGRSVNGSGFFLAILKDLGVVKAKEDNSRHHERVAGTTVLQALAARIAEAKDADSGKAKRKKAE